MTSLPAATLAILLTATPAPGDTFNERWPQPVSVPAVLDTPKIETPRHHRHHAERRDRCQRRYYYRGRHQYWRCRR